jgi:hypothetical protein
MKIRTDKSNESIILELGISDFDKNFHNFDIWHKILEGQ